jgi:hypothetical protein
MKLTKSKIGRAVKIIGVPALKGMSEDCRKESEPVFRYLVGKKKRIVGIDEYGCAEFEFVIRKGPFKGSHTVWIEPEHLKEIR